jgi:glycosyltransferase involved in cell wall biosynthesis
MILFFACDGLKGSWRRQFNDNMHRAFEKYKVPFRMAYNVNEGEKLLKRFNSKDTVIFVGDTQETRWHSLIQQAKGLRVGHKHGGRFVYLDYANFYDFNEEKEFEECRLFDKIFVNSTSVQETYKEYGIETIVTGFPFNFKKLNKYKTEEKVPNRILINSRLTNDKNPYLLLDFLSTRAKDFEVVFTLPYPYFENDGVKDLLFNLCRSKQLNWKVHFDLDRESYYREVAKAEYVLNFAQAETLGLSVLEAVYLGAYPVVPNAHGYIDYIPSTQRYEPYSYNHIMDILNSKQNTSTIKQNYDYKEVFKHYMKEVGVDVKQR